MDKGDNDDWFAGEGYSAKEVVAAINNIRLI
jgi:hypothetical protein